MGCIWRFYADERQEWRWQQLTTDRTVIAESNASYKKYEACIVDAESNGYVMQLAQPKLNRAHSR